MAEKIIIYHPEWNQGDNCIHLIYKKLLKVLPDSYPNFEFEIHCNSEKWGEDYEKWLNGQRHRWGFSTFTILNPKNNKYILIDYNDDLTWVVKDKEDFGGTCVNLLSSSGHLKPFSHWEKINIDVPVTPISYPHVYGEIETLINMNFGRYERTIPKRLFLCMRYFSLFRRYMFNDPRFLTIHRDTYQPTEEWYTRYLCSNFIAFDCVSANEFPCRSIDILASGAALIRTKLLTEFDEPLEPDYHYISVEWPDWKPNEYDLKSVQKFYAESRDRIIEKFEEVGKDVDYLKWIGENGRNWYLRNGSVESNTNIILKNINLKLLE